MVERNPDATALRFALRSTYPELRKAAVEVIRQILSEHAGSVLAAAKSANLSVDTLYRMAQEHPEVQRVVDAARGQEARKKKSGRGPAA